MDNSVRGRLLAINATFYDQHAEAFAATRYGAQPGWDQIITYFPPGCQVLDLGCGNGRFARYLWSRLSGAAYVGVDGSARLIELARRDAPPLAEFRALDVSRPGWEQTFGAGEFGVVLALAVLHHLPGFDLRAAFLRSASHCLAPTGVLILSNWEFTRHERMRDKIIPWATVRLADADVEPGDFLLNWQSTGVRYVHHIDEVEAEALAVEAGLRVVQQFYADGREGDLSLYSVLRR